MTRVSIHQPEFVPYIDFFKKIHDSNIFISYDICQFNKQTFQNRNILLINGIPKIITLPVKKYRRNNKLKEIELVKDERYYRSLRKMISTNYMKYPYYSECIDILEPLFSKNYTYLYQLNMQIIINILNYLEIKTEIVYSSDLVRSQDSFNQMTATQKNLFLVERVGGKEYLSGVSGVDYLDNNSFKEKNISLMYLNPTTLEKKYISIIHYLMIYGKEIKEILNVKK